MNKKILSTVILGLLATGCSTQPDQITLEDEVALDKKPQDEVVITLDESGMITDEVAIVEVTEDTYLEDLDYILTEDGFSMRINEAKAEDKKVVLENNIIYFKFDSSKITQEMKNVISTQLDFLKKYPKIKVILEGHTDERGSNAYNVVLGEKRAKSVRKMLLDAGIKENQIEVISYGEMKPSDSSSTKEAWSKNRRVVFIYK